MRLLLDTHVVIWWYQEPKKIKNSTIALISDRNNSVFVSDVVIWEMVIKTSLGKLKTLENLYKEIENDFDAMPIKTNHIHGISSLEFIHHDPFDRLLIAQSVFENIPLITSDKQINRYDLQIIKP
ncbi:MAG: type II toxin-antitoxin system VapC family toxin [Cytophagales bacterium]|nr:type II toxin-antitoxin system VapC family toxin [Cytophagales bacterium]MCA6365852.1 type II toxin-antitoxin system VapC family toxin [Cytophagales bacterium]MCA6371248.1 type II toxin-antitoxin system VapC family toxin [Cytophagales bacterium]MCA6374985.1 type II toxin-antitoxin system VapC family toxin [Cytophagales bacterium]MCA6382706.1 type II toxin-antitoxin system VapC family toxin [Cytophagales bacterium]